MMNIHPTAIISEKAKIATSATIGPYCIIGADVEIGNDCSFLSHVVVKGPTIIEEGNIFYQFSTIGEDTPDKKYKGEKTKLLIGKKNNLYLICEKKKAKKIIVEKKISEKQVVEFGNFEKLIKDLKGNKMIIDYKTCSLFFENVLWKKFKILKKEDPIYFLKSIKSNEEIKNMVSSHIIDGAALTKFLYWIKVKNKKKITEYEAQKKLEFFRKKNKKY